MNEKNLVHYEKQRFILFLRLSTISMRIRHNKNILENE
jgi:hypothetical protein